MPGPTVSALLKPGDHASFYRAARGWHRELIRRAGSLAMEADVGLVICARWLAPYGGSFENDLIDIRAACTQVVNDLRKSQIRCKESSDFAPYDGAMWDVMVEDLSGAVSERIAGVQRWIDALTIPDLSSVTDMPEPRQTELHGIPASLAAHLEALRQCLDPAYLDDWLNANPPA